VRRRVRDVLDRFFCPSLGLAIVPSHDASNAQTRPSCRTTISKSDDCFPAFIVRQISIMLMSLKRQ
jgi:hypothetical protein